LFGSQSPSSRVLAAAMMQDSSNPDFISRHSIIERIGKPRHKHGAIIASELCISARFAAHAPDGVVDCWEEFAIEADFLAPIPRQRCLDVTLCRA
jgi:hypothetical protein